MLRIKHSRRRHLLDTVRRLRAFTVQALPPGRLVLLAESYTNRWSPPFSLFARLMSRLRTTRSVGDLHTHAHTVTSLLEQVSSVKQRGGGVRCRVEQRGAARFGRGRKGSCL